MSNKLTLAAFALLCGHAAFSQGQDSTPFERDLQVIDALLPGKFANANQAYFDVRGDRDVKHGSLTVDVEPLAAPGDVGGFFVTLSRGDAPRRSEFWSLSAAANGVRMRVWAVGDRARVTEDLLAGDAACELIWRREAAQFRARATAACVADHAAEMVLSERQLWLAYPGPPGGDFEMHRARPFECYADIPGVGGGRDEPYERYGGFAVHDQGGAAWFTSAEGRRLGISLFLVDWPINNLPGTFTRDSLVVYVNEDLDGERKQHGYAFTLPEADRIGINLKWILVNCYMQSNAQATPYM